MRINGFGNEYNPTTELPIGVTNATPRIPHTFHYDCVYTYYSCSSDNITYKSHIPLSVNTPRSIITTPHLAPL